eukprot:CAMPEP_0176023800 /NCGR_PEP_ID=MMETSP0120_2-20121206/11617_1 /TAXON_ID=160619 /ORGANISM="Kryptoperidinium foliaceum, Strain CCMP 1326" /LENGTH=206 /DNA_ID=CAMNT_0017356967 /DNA_START=92 /DNA_END=712 /DNA_ORIENTATION=-
MAEVVEQAPILEKVEYGESGDIDTAVPAKVGKTLVVPLEYGWQDQDIGMALEAFEPSGCVFVSGVSSNAATAIGSYNEHVEPSERVRQGDYVVSIDGHTDLHSMRRCLRSNATMDLTIQRPFLFEVRVQKSGRPLGLAVKYDASGASLMVRRVEENGAVAAANGDLVCGDRIVGVNCASYCARAMLEELRNSDCIELTISRCLGPV